MQLDLVYSKKLDEIFSKDSLLYNLLNYIDSKFLDDPED